MPQALFAVSAFSLIIWIYLLCCRSFFWRADTFLRDSSNDPQSWPEVIAVVPARDESEVIGQALSSLVTQDYPGSFSVILIDDHSTDDTIKQAEQTAETCGRSDRLRVLHAGALPSGWTGKLWALSEGLNYAESTAPRARYIWFTDADIQHDQNNLRQLVAKAEQDDCDLVSLMAMLSCQSFWERLLLPPFVFFFQKLYPFPWVNDSQNKTAAGAGGCMLIRLEALRQAGGLERIRNELIDDCALARLIKTKGRAGGGRIWLGLTKSARSIRPYTRLRDIWEMVTRTAFTQLRHSPWLLAGTILGMIFTYLLPPFAVLALLWHGNLAAVVTGGLAWALMATAMRPTLLLYGQPIHFALILPFSALLYTLMTIHSAWVHYLGRGGLWKGRHWHQE